MTPAQAAEKRMAAAAREYAIALAQLAPHFAAQPDHRTDEEHAAFLDRIGAITEETRALSNELVRRIASHFSKGDA